MPNLRLSLASHTETVMLSLRSPNLMISSRRIRMAIASFGTTSAAVQVPISNPTSGAYGWEDSISGGYHDGKPDYSRMQKDHDEHYPLWAQRKSALKPWPADAAQRFDNGQPYPYQPKCGRPCEPNKDPGSTPGAYGNYHPAPSSEYFPPKDWTGSCDDNYLKSLSTSQLGRKNSTSRSRVLARRYRNRSTWVVP
ncbi:hypothetical protein PGT21_002600 [Puccinia graminis f. sp. tritici]|uniref:Uncharacterized protein n=1 Tax=Puccinia graminis f. sp. tritici TaxID=56615 RepID=A0A5B0QEY1_PUCGR|nr:hypothetical protein PGT21_002600 [Puccinia graminis f. sp. tritici]